MTASFLDWVSGAAIYIGYARYGQLGGHGFVVASNYEDLGGELQRAVEDLDAGDIEALAAADRIAVMKDCWYANDPDPLVAMAKLMDKMREVHRGISIQQEIALARPRRPKWHSYWHSGRRHAWPAY
jgi:hypothetical protein